MVCRDCGAYLPRGAKRCPECGRPVPRRRRERGGRTALILAAVTLAALLLAVGISLLSRKPGVPAYAGVLERYFNALENRDAAAFASTRPEAYIAYLTREGGAYLNYTVYVNDMAQDIDRRMNEYTAACGRNVRISFRVDKAVDIAPYVEKISSILARWYAFPENSVSRALIVEGSYTVKGSSASQTYPIGETLLLEIGGEWYFSPDIGQSWRE